jgi:recombinational DNA repair protein (RecF pathway)
MIFCDHGIVLWRRPLRENDRIVTVFTRDRGKLEVNFKSVRLPKGKLRALSEPVSWGDYRFYLKTGSNFPVCTGGSSLSVFPRVRLDTGSLFTALYFCEVVNKLTPSHQPSPEKYELLLGALQYLESGVLPGALPAEPGAKVRGISPWMRRAFTLRALETAGFGFKHSSLGLDSRLWETLHNGTWPEVHVTEPQPQAMDYLDDLLKRFFSEQLGLQLKTLEFI